ncbi:MAG: DeoR/GlpR family DNA-binding transcription regulator [Rhodospirillales bacterium]|nr:DeoR/GlpR family DNA-binding transcription regulator [Rhodospirillales bacterium]
MHRSARQARIMKTLDLEGACSVTELARQLAVSDETIRRDVTAMASKGLLERVHGGVVLPQLLREPAFQKRLQHNAEAKARIARRVAAMVRNGDSLMLDTGSTTAYVARALADHSGLMVVTNCTEIAGRLAGRNRVYLAGGELRADDGAVFGASAMRFVEQFRVRYAVLSIGAIDPRDGLMDFYLQEAEFSRAVMAQASQTLVVADHSKFGIQAPVRVCRFDQVDVLVTDDSPPDALRRCLEEAGTELLIAD